MVEIRNNANRLVCCADSRNKIVEIVIKGIKTTIQFTDNSTIKVVNAEMPK
jgi:hypothetical protein